MVGCPAHTVNPLKCANGGARRNDIRTPDLLIDPLFEKANLCENSRLIGLTT